ncbi:MAG: DegT/DnrJ/EryC1/StrS family aminotransferase [Solirubrobacterales bacterium]|jgi:dTDP-4-amino-4,6-dideoxygalactose transaminase|nr:DegT/DnrJ/EryC1/StrS family aminotransferase [Solirubrobacterales bacterium]
MAVPLFDPSTPLEPLQPAIRAAVDDVLRSGRFILGPNVEAFEHEWAAYTGTTHAVGVANGTEAITIALRALGVGPGDDVVVPSFTYFASAEAIPPTGARVVFCDVDPATSCVTLETVREAVTPRTKAVVAVHLFGNVAPVREIEEELGLPVVEDVAQASGSIAADGSRPGNLGAIGTFSFYPSKNLGAFGDGGAITTSDGALAERVRTLRFHGSKDKVTYTEVGYNSRLDELQAAILRVQLPKLDGWADHRRAAGGWYADAGLGSHAALPEPTPGARPAWGLYVVRLPEPDRVGAALRERGIGASGYYRVPIHQQPVFAAEHGARSLPGTDEAARTHLAIPISAAITHAQVEEVVEAIRDAV